MISRHYWLELTMHDYENGFKRVRHLEICGDNFIIDATNLM
jgi:hypothetical protein